MSSEVGNGSLVKLHYVGTHDDGEVFPVDAVWAYGIIIEVSNNDPMSVALVRLDTKTYQILHMIHDGFEVVSKAHGG